MTPSLVIANARALTLSRGSRPRRGSALSDLAIIDPCDVLIVGDRVTCVAPSPLPPGLHPRDADRIDAEGRVLMPAFVDAHTHACFAGSRLAEWESKLKGVPYLDILKAGGGIMSTVRSVRAAGEHALADALKDRLRRFALAGTLAVEVKSGYGLTGEAELTMLRAISAAARQCPWISVRPTALLGHAIDGDDARVFVDRTISEALPAVSREFPGVPVDLYCEKGAWSVEQSIALLARARELGHPIRVHTDQFNSLGMIREAVLLGAMCADHLEAATPEDLALLAKSASMGGFLPISAFHLGQKPANARAFVDHGGAACIATNFNPGTGPSLSMPLAIALAVRQCGLTPAEAIAAATTNPACLLGLHDRGVIAPGMRADLLLLRHRDERALAFEMGEPHVDVVLAGGNRLG